MDKADMMQKIEMTKLDYLKLRVIYRADGYQKAMKICTNYLTSLETVQNCHDLIEDDYNEEIFLTIEEKTFILKFISVLEKQTSKEKDNGQD